LISSNSELILQFINHNSNNPKVFLIPTHSFVNDPNRDPFASKIDDDGVTFPGTTEVTDGTYLWKPFHHYSAVE
jgi:hypothetical protein